MKKERMAQPQAYKMRKSFTLRPSDNGRGQFPTRSAKPSARKKTNLKKLIN